MATINRTPEADIFIESPLQDSIFGFADSDILIEQGNNDQ